MCSGLVLSFGIFCDRHFAIGSIVSKFWWSTEELRLDGTLWPLNHLRYHDLIGSRYRTFFHCWIPFKWFSALSGDYLPFRLHSIRILLTGWCLMVLVLVNSYSGTLTSHLTLPVYTKTINSFEDLAMKADEMIVDSHSAFSDFLLVILLTTNN